MRTNNAGVVSSSPAGLPIKTLLVRKATRNHRIKSTCLDKAQCMSLVSAKLETEYATQATCFNGRMIEKIDNLQEILRDRS